MRVDSQSTLSLQYDAFLRRGSGPHRALLAELGWVTSLALGAYVVTLAVVTPASGEQRAVTVTVGVFAVAAGAFLRRMSAHTPIWCLDVAAVFGAALVGTVAMDDGPIRQSIVTLLVVYCTPLWVTRSDRALAGFTALVAATYAVVLLHGPPSEDRLARCVAFLAALVVLAAVTRWLLSNVGELMVAERRARTEAEDAQVRLGEVRRERTEFGRRLSHELRTPLNAIVGYGEMLVTDDRLRLTEEQRSHAGDILASARHLGALVDDLFRLGTHRADPASLVREETDIADLLHGTCRMMSDRARRDGLGLSVHVEPGLPHVLVDRRKIRQVVLNLVGNALKFTPRGGAVDVSAHLVGDEVEVVVRDTGEGIELHEQPLVFEEFHTTGDPSVSTGLGLPLARDFVHRHGGTMWLDSAPGEGSSFHFRLPLDPGEAAAPTGKATRDAAAASGLETHDAWDAFTQPGSLASRRLIGAVTARIILTGCVVSTIVVLTTPAPGDRRGFAIAGPALAVSILAVPWRRLGPRAHRGLIDIGGITVTLAITAWLFAEPAFEDLLPLAYLWVPLTAFALWPRPRAAGHLVLVVVAYTGYLAVQQPPGTGARALVDLVALLAIPCGIVSWAVDTVRTLAVAEKQARVTSELVGTRLREATTDVRALLRGVSHDLRAPLSSVIGFARLLADEPGIDPVARSYAEEIEAAASPLLHLVNDTLELARLDDPSITIEREEVRLADLVTRAAQRASGPSPGPTLDMAFDDDLVVVGDERLLDRSVYELVENAVRFGPRDGTVRVRAGIRAGRIEICVSDDGDRRGSGDVEPSFAPFVHHPRATAGSSPSGPGLGLAIARRIAELHGGDLTSGGEAGTSSFVISLPATAAVRAAEPEVLG